MKKRVEKATDGKTDIITLIPETEDDYEAIFQGIEAGQIDDGASPGARQRTEGTVVRLRSVIEQLERRRRVWRP